MINIGLNKELDYKVYGYFHEFSVAGVDFGASIKKDHPGINLENKKHYIDNFYNLNQNLLHSSLLNLQEAVESKQSDFFKAVQEVFGVDFSLNKYEGYISIFNCNPRFVENKTFQVYYKKDLLDKIEVVFHEVLHFVFFDFCDKNLSRETEGLNKNNGPLWELSEIVNIIILNKPEFRKLMEREELSFYPDLREKLKVIKKVFESDLDIKRAIVNSLEYLKT